jgi:hypothetical protein
MIKRLFVVKVLLGSHIVMLPAQGRPIGYHQRSGVTAESESDALALVRNYVIKDTGCSIPSVENQGEPDFDGEDAEKSTCRAVMNHAASSTRVGGRFIGEPTKKTNRAVCLTDWDSSYATE